MSIEQDVERLIERLQLAPALAERLRVLATNPTEQNYEGSLATLIDEESSDEMPLLSNAYVDLGEIGRGGLAVVHRVLQKELDRTVAVKTLRPDRVFPAMVQRFILEAQVTSQLNHPGIIPVHTMGWTNDGRPFFSMKEVRGKDLLAMNQHVHRRGGRTADGWTVSRLVDAVRRASEAVGHAHSLGVVHRDLKPENIMIGEHGEVLVVDWGLAKTPGARETNLRSGPQVSAELGRKTRVGQIAGTPRYMSPEQARDGITHIDERSDVFSLGIILYEVLYGTSPFPEDLTIDELLLQVQQVRVVAPGAVADEALADIWRKATEPKAEHRFANAAEVADAIRRWQEGDAQLKRSDELVRRAEGFLPKMRKGWAAADQLRLRAAQMSKGLKSWTPIEKKRPMWLLEDQAQVHQEQADQSEGKAIQLLELALRQYPRHERARMVLGELYRSRHEEAEEAGERSVALRLQQRLEDVNTGVHTEYLKGQGRISLLTTPKGALVRLFEWKDVDRRLVPKFVRNLGVTPLAEEVLPIGSWLLQIVKEGYEPVNYPIKIRRMEHWNSVAPKEQHPTIIWLPKKGSLGPNDCYVPAGFFTAGRKEDGNLRQVWLPAYLVKRYPVTRGQYAAILNKLPKSRSETLFSAQPMYNGVTLDDGGYRSKEPNTPMTEVSRSVAAELAVAFSKQVRRHWILPTQLMWEKAARGVDARTYSWGNQSEPTYVVCRDGTRHTPAPVDVTRPIVDVSCYGVRHLCGNVMEWTSEEEADGRGIVRGGGVPVFGQTCRTTLKVAFAHEDHYPGVGFRFFSWL